MKNPILIDSYWEISDDTKLVRLASLTTIIYSVIFVIYVIYQSYYLLSDATWQAESLDIALNYINFFMENIEMLWFAFVWILVLAIWYFLLPPIADWALISYVNDKNKWWKSALAKWFLNFFPMFEYNAMTSVVNFLIFFIAVSRAYTMWILDNIFIQVIIWIWWFMIFFTSIFFHYAKFLIVLEWMWPVDAMKRSIILSVENFWITLKFVFINYLLYIRFLINIIILIFIPWIIILISDTLWFIDTEIMKYITYLIFWFLIIITAYINWIIEAFFITYWHKVYKIINKDSEESKDE